MELVSFFSLIAQLSFSALRRNSYDDGRMVRYRYDGTFAQTYSLNDVAPYAKVVGMSFLFCNMISFYSRGTAFVIGLHFHFDQTHWLG